MAVWTAAVALKSTKGAPCLFRKEGAGSFFMLKIHSCQRLLHLA